MLGPCALCLHEIRAGFGYSPTPEAPIVWTDSALCVELIARTPDMTKNEEAALKQAGRAAGEYLDELGETDLAELTEEQYQTFLRTLFETYSETLVELAGGNKPPF